MPFDRTAFRDAWQSSGKGLTPQFLSDFIKNNPQFAEGVVQDKDRVMLPTGEQMDLIGDVGGEGGASWSGIGPSAYGGPSQYNAVLAQMNKNNPSLLPPSGSGLPPVTAPSPNMPPVQPFLPPNGIDPNQLVKLSQQLPGIQTSQYQTSAPSMSVSNSIISKPPVNNQQQPDLNPQTRLRPPSPTTGMPSSTNSAYGNNTGGKFYA